MLHALARHSFHPWFTRYYSPAYSASIEAAHAELFPNVLWVSYICTCERVADTQFPYHTVLMIRAVIRDQVQTIFEFKVEWSRPPDSKNLGLAFYFPLELKVSQVTLQRAAACLQRCHRLRNETGFFQDCCLVTSDRHSQVYETVHDLGIDFPVRLGDAWRMRSRPCLRRNSNPTLLNAAKDIAAGTILNSDGGLLTSAGF